MMVDLKMRRHLFWLALADVLKTDAGQRALIGIASIGDLSARSYVPGDTHATAFNEGRRAYAMRIIQEMHEAYPDILVKIATKMEEYNVSS